MRWRLYDRPLETPIGMPEPQADTIAYSIVIPIFNEESALPALFERLEPILDQLDGPAEVILVDDGSRDRSAAIATDKAKLDRRYRVISLSRNFGHQIAITAGMDLASGQAVVVMDADLQDPPELLIEMVAKWKAGNEIVYAERRSREGESHFKRWTANLFYRLLRRLSAVDIPRNVGDFRLIDRKALEVFKQMPEHDRFVRGMFGWMGFRQASVLFDRPARVLGETKYPLRKMISLSLHGIVGFSDTPLRLALWLGFFISAIAGFMCLYVIGLVLYDYRLVPGWASTMVLISFLSGVNLLMTGVVGLYVGRIHAEVKRRPLYVTARRVGFAADGPS
jgi:glycosyltransferase involved in cell wall biosynthesis